MVIVGTHLDLVPLERRNAMETLWCERITALFQGPKGKGFPHLAGIYFVGCPEVGRIVRVMELANALYDVAMEMEFRQGDEWWGREWYS